MPWLDLGSELAEMFGEAAQYQEAQVEACYANRLEQDRQACRNWRNAHMTAVRSSAKAMAEHKAKLESKREPERQRNRERYKAKMELVRSDERASSEYRAKLKEAYEKRKANGYLKRVAELAKAKRLEKPEEVRMADRKEAARRLARIYADPKAHAEFLARKRENYRKRKAAKDVSHEQGKHAQTERLLPNPASCHPSTVL